MKRITTILTILTLSLTSCLAAQLKQPSREHHLQLATLCAACGQGECSAELTEDVCSSAEQACLISAIADGRDGSECE